MTAAMLLGLTRAAAARFSFLLGIPAIGAAGVFELRELLKHGAGEAGLLALAVGTTTSAVSGYLAIDLLLRYLRRNTTHLFVWYRIGLGLLLLTLVLIFAFQAENLTTRWLAVLQTNDPADKKRIEGQVAWETEKGLALTQPFYSALAEFEQSGQPFDEFLPTLFEHLPECGR
jgi:hypothetical protein